jgi:hypothetical protein
VCPIRCATKACSPSSPSPVFTVQGLGSRFRGLENAQEVARFRARHLRQRFVALRLRAAAVRGRGAGREMVVVVLVVVLLLLLLVALDRLRDA